MKFRIALIDPFGTVTARGEMATEPDSVFDSGIAHIVGQAGGEQRDTMHAVALQLNADERAEQIALVTDNGRYVQSGRAPYSIDVMAVADGDR